MEIHLGVQRHVQHVREARGRGEVIRPGDREREHAAVLDEKAVVLMEVVLVAVPGERPVAQPEHKRVRLDPRPNRRGGLVEAGKRRHGARLTKRSRAATGAEITLWDAIQRLKASHVDAPWVCVRA